MPYENEARLYIPFASIRYRGQGMALMVIQAGRVSEREVP